MLCGGEGGIVTFDGTTLADRSADADVLLVDVAQHLALCASRQTTRDQHRPFLPPTRPGDAFGIPFLSTTLHRRLSGLGAAKADGWRWDATIGNLRQKGLRADELNRS